MPIYKALFVTTIMIECDNNEDAHGFFDQDMGYILGEANDGEAIGQTVRSYIIEVPADTVKMELTKLNNDGTFFDDPTKGG